MIQFHHPCFFFLFPLGLTLPRLPNPVPSPRSDLPNAGLANITATSLNLLGFEAPTFYEASLLEAK